MQLFQKGPNIGPNLPLRHQHKLRFQLLHNFRQREVAVAKLQNDAPRTFETHRTFRTKHHRGLCGSTPTAPFRKFRDTGVGKLGQDVFAGCDSLLATDSQNTSASTDSRDFRFGGRGTPLRGSTGGASCIYWGLITPNTPLRLFFGPAV